MTPTAGFSRDAESLAAPFFRWFDLETERCPDCRARWYMAEIDNAGGEWLTCARDDCALIWQPRPETLARYRYTTHPRPPFTATETAQEQPCAVNR